MNYLVLSRMLGADVDEAIYAAFLLSLIIIVGACFVALSL